MTAPDPPSRAQVHAIHEVTEPFHAILYFASEVQERWAGLGFEPRGEGYVAGRAAPMGPVGPELAAATFFNFNPALFDHVLPGAWATADPETVLATRAEGIQAVFERVDAPTDDLDELTALLVRTTAGLSLHGRPLAAANAGIALPQQPFARAWQAHAVLREHRGDGHVALLTASGLSPVAALRLYAGWQDAVSARFLQRSRLWDDEAWAEGLAELRARGLADEDAALTAEGVELRDRIEADTDRLAAAPYERLGVTRTARLFELVRPLAVALAEGDAFPRRPRVPERFPGS